MGYKPRTVLKISKFLEAKSNNKITCKETKDRFQKIF